MAGKVKFEFARTGIIAFIIVGLLGAFVPSGKRLIVFGPVAVTLLLGLLLGKYRTMPFGSDRNRHTTEADESAQRPGPSDDMPHAQL
jgi:hypothetical protein